MIRGINTKKGIENTGGSLEFYKGLIRDFYKKHATHTDKISELVFDGNYKAAEIEAHSLKGVLCMLGIEQLNQLASKVEEALREHHMEEFNRLIQPLKKQLDRLFKEIDSSEWLYESTQESALLELDEQSRSVLLKKLSHLMTIVKEGNYRAEALVSNLLRDYAAFELKKELLELNARIEDLDFEEAIDLIKNIQKGI